MHEENLIMNLINKIHSLYDKLEQLWMDELYHEQKEWDKAHLLYPSE